MLPSDRLFNSFLDPKYIPAGEDKYTLRNRQVKKPVGDWRHLRSDEIEALVKNDNSAVSWDNIMVTDRFSPHMVRNNHFYGFVRIGRITGDGLQYHDLRLPCGITNSSIHSCDIGDDCAIHNVHYLSHYIMGDRCILFNVQEMSCTDHAKFGNGILKEGEDESVRVRLNLMNEAGGREVMPFDGMLPADAYMWAKFVDDKALQERLGAFTQSMFDSRRGYYGTVGTGTVIKNSLIIKDVKIGEHCYIKGASKLKNITINSSLAEPSQIGENVVLVNGIVGYGCRIFYSCIAVRFVLGSHSSLKYGARLIHSYMGDNSTISCCEVLNNLIFPFHEQHHNNSFLIASLIKGQSNMAAGATIGSNHNSRTNDGEIEAGRGFWPGLCTSVKHSSRFASYVLLEKADYPYELDIPFPFSLVSHCVSQNQLQVTPAFWWLSNMYALIRNNDKYARRDLRVNKLQHIEYDMFAPDSMEECIAARKLLEQWTALAYGGAEGTHEDLRRRGRNLLNGPRATVDALEVLGYDMERSSRPVRILKVYDAYRSYGDMLVYYAVHTVVPYMETHPDLTFEELGRSLDSVRQREWINLGGQLMMRDDFDLMVCDIKSGTLNSWDDVHRRYQTIWDLYPLHKLRHAYLALKFVLGVEEMSGALWEEVLEKGLEIRSYVNDRVYQTRKRDYDNPFRRNTYRNAAEMEATLGPLETDDCICRTRKETEAFSRRVNKAIQRLRAEFPSR